VVVNAGAGRVRRDQGLYERLAALVPAGQAFATADPGELDPTFAKLRAAGVDSIAIVGGDGSVTWSLSALLRVWPREELPRVALLPGGSVNTLARHLSGGGAPDRLLARLCAQAEPRERVVEPLEIRAAASAPRHGLLFGNGVVTRWLDLYHAHPSRGPLAAAATLAQAVAGVFTARPSAERLFAPFEARVEIDGEALPDREFTAMAAAAVPAIGLGFHPFFHAGTTPGRFHFAHTRARPLELAFDLPVARYGRRRPGSPLRDARAANVAITTATPQGYMVDGDVFPPVGSLELRAGPPLRIWMP
jgi:diacylglycerol kinase family enzyme